MKILATSNHGNTFNPKEGADVRKYNLLVELSKHNDICVLESDRYEYDKKEIPSNIRVKYFHEINVGGYPLSFLLDFNLSYILKLIRLIKKENFDLIQISFCYGIVITKLVTLLMNRKITIIYDAHNVEADYIFQSFTKKSSFFVNNCFRIYVSLIEKVAVNCVDHIICVSENDKQTFMKKYNLSYNNLTVIPSGAKIRYLSTQENKKKFKKFFGIDENKIVILFHGTYNYSPNKNAIDLIIQYIAPTIEEKFKNVVFLLAGNGTPVFEKNNIISLGFVENLDSILYASDIAIVPILHGGGTRLKILDYMSVGLPIVSTKKGIEGIDAINRKDAIICDSVNEEFITEILLLLGDNIKRKNLGVNVHKLIKEKYDWEVLGFKLFSIYKNILYKC